MLLRGCWTARPNRASLSRYAWAVPEDAKPAAAPNSLTVAGHPSSVMAHSASKARFSRLVNAATTEAATLRGRTQSDCGVSSRGKGGSTRAFPQGRLCLLVNEDVCDGGQNLSLGSQRRSVPRRVLPSVPEAAQPPEGRSASGRSVAAFCA